MDWNEIRAFVHGRLFCAGAVLEGQEVRVFPIGSLRVDKDGLGSYFEIFARPLPEGANVTFMAVDASPLFWLSSLLRGRFSHPPAIRLKGTVGISRSATDHEQARWYRRVGLLLKTRGGKALWGKPGKVREIRFHAVEPVRAGNMTRHLDHWAGL